MTWWLCRTRSFLPLCLLIHWRSCSTPFAKCSFVGKLSFFPSLLIAQTSFLLTWSGSDLIDWSRELVFLLNLYCFLCTYFPIRNVWASEVPSTPAQKYHCCMMLYAHHISTNAHPNGKPSIVQFYHRPCTGKCHPGFSGFNRGTTWRIIPGLENS